MTEPNTTKEGAAENDTTTKTPRTLSELVPLVARRLKAHGVAKVLARYEGKEYAFMFMSTDERSLAQLSAVMTALEIKQALQAILDRRYPRTTDREGTSGFFEWDLAADTLQHEHVVIHHGI
jgi:hypothetical protein